MVNIKGLNKAHLLASMVSGTEIISPWWGLDLRNAPAAVELGYIDYYQGVAIKIDFRHDEVSSFAYNRDAGANKMERIVAQMRKQEEEAAAATANQK
jgi:hypothetical protein